jgi:hypothetical protein
LKILNNDSRNLTSSFRARFYGSRQAYFEQKISYNFEKREPGGDCSSKARMTRDRNDSVLSRAGKLEVFFTDRKILLHNIGQEQSTTTSSSGLRQSQTENPFETH